ncbi:hypothetical protein J6590_056948 [Homalodisca vitripennis]|nr:hypothetical protein J6590_056948 [Homalodisca vitripennis]
MGVSDWIGPIAVLTNTSLYRRFTIDKKYRQLRQPSRTILSCEAPSLNGSCLSWHGIDLLVCVCVSLVNFQLF